MSGRCDKEYCVGRVSIFVEEDCDGSDCECEMSHCVNCGELGWSSKGLNCEKCGDYWCPSWQNFFLFDCCEQIEELPYEYMCVFCAIEHMSCQHEKCKTYLPKLAQLAKDARNNGRDSMAQGFAALMTRSNEK